MPRLLVYTRTTGYRHASIPAGIAALRGLDGYSADATEDPAVFRVSTLRDYAAIEWFPFHGGRVEADGSYRVVGLPGPGVIAISPCRRFLAIGETSMLPFSPGKSIGQKVRTDEA